MRGRVRRLAGCWLVALIASGAAGMAGAAPRAELATGAMRNFTFADAPKPVAEGDFKDLDDNPANFAAFKGKLTLLNLWATWCVPCRKEMPGLDKLAQKLSGEHFQVVALAIDRAGPGKVKAFIDEVGASHLKVYVDQTTRLGRPLGAIGMPTTLLLDPEGREIGRILGEAQWDAPEAETLIKAILAGG